MKSGPLEVGEASRVSTPTIGVKRVVSIIELNLRIVAAIGTLASSVAMGTTDEMLPFFTQFTQFKAEYNDFPTFTFFVIANSIVCGYLVLISLPLSVFHMISSRVKTSRVILIFLDTAMLTLLTAGASASAAIVYLAHNGNASANWFAICQQFNNFCERISGSLIGSFGAIVVFVLLILLSALALSQP